MIYHIIVCEVCGKIENMDNPWREEWFIENISHQVCSRECFEKQCRETNHIKEPK